MVYTAGDKLVTIRVEMMKLRVPGDIRSLEVLDRTVADKFGNDALRPDASSY